MAGEGGGDNLPGKGISLIMMGPLATNSWVKLPLLTVPPSSPPRGTESLVNLATLIFSNLFFLASVLAIDASISAIISLVGSKLIGPRATL